MGLGWYLNSYIHTENLPHSRSLLRVGLPPSPQPTLWAHWTRRRGKERPASSQCQVAGRTGRKADRFHVPMETARDGSGHRYAAGADMWDLKLDLVASDRVRSVQCSSRSDRAFDTQQRADQRARVRA